MIKNKFHFLNKLLKFSVLLFLLNSCIVKNLTKNYDCPIYCDKHHLLTGKKAIVGTRYGKLKNSAKYNYPFARRPHSMGCLTPRWPVGRLVKIYVCDSCTRELNQSKGSQWKLKKNKLSTCKTSRIEKLNIFECVSAIVPVKYFNIENQ
jgi:hypothetical protein